MKIVFNYFVFIFCFLCFISCNERKVNWNDEDDFYNLGFQNRIYYSHNNGLYSNSIKLQLLASKATDSIYYTLNGAEPTYNSTLYSGPISLSGDYRKDSLSHIITSPPDILGRSTFHAPKKDIGNIHVVRFATFSNGTRTSGIYNKSYIINNYMSDSLLNVYNWFDRKSSLNKVQHYLPVISLIIDSKYFFDNDSGIYVPGNRYNIEKKGNYALRGPDSERLIFFQWYDQTGKFCFEQYAGVRIHGGITRRFPQKSLKFYARERYGFPSFKYPIFSKSKQAEYKRFILESMRESGGGQALIEDIVAQQIVKDLPIEKQSFSPVQVFLNGEYWGIHNIREKIDEFYLSDQIGCNKDELDIIDGNPSSIIPYEPIKGDNSEYIGLMDYIQHNSLSDNQNYVYVSEKIDIDNYIDYILVQLFFSNYDWPVHNMKLWKRKKNGKWRWIIYDLDGGFNNRKRDFTYNMFTHLTNKIDCENCPNPPSSTLLFRSLLNNDIFRNKLRSRSSDLLTNFLDTTISLNVLDSIVQVYDPYMKRHIERWKFPYTYRHHWKSSLDIHVRDFLKNRPKAFRHNLDMFLNSIE